PIAPPAKPGGKVDVVPGAGNRTDFREAYYVAMVQSLSAHDRYTSRRVAACQPPIADRRFEVPTMDGSPLTFSFDAGLDAALARGWESWISVARQRGVERTAEWLL